MSNRLRMTVALVAAFAVSIAADAILVDHGSIDETIYGGSVIGVWPALGLASAVAFVYAASWAGRVLQRRGDPYSKTNDDSEGGGDG